MEIRKAKISDLEAITRIYNEAILTTTATFDTETKTMRYQEEWFFKHSDKYPILVAEGEKEILGWASLSLWSDREAYNKTTENSIYIFSEYRGQGIGNNLLGEIIELAKENKFHTIIARIAGNNEASIRLHKKYGFENVGCLKEVGFKFDSYIDVNMMQLTLD